MYPFGFGWFIKSFKIGTRSTVKWRGVRSDVGVISDGSYELDHETLKAFYLGCYIELKRGQGAASLRYQLTMALLLCSQESPSAKSATFFK